MSKVRGLLGDILAASDIIAEFIQGMTLASFIEDLRTVSAVERQLITIGEAANRLPESVRNDRPDVPWEKMIRIRHFYVHGYDRVRPEEVWTTASRLIPHIRTLITPIAAEFSIQSVSSTEPDQSI